MPFLRDYQTAANNKIGRRNHVTTFLEELPSSQDIIPGDERVTWIGDMPTQVNLRAAVKPLSSPASNFNGTLVDKEATWILPVIPSSGKPVRLTPQRAPQDAKTENYISLIRKLVTSSGIYALASLASPLVSLALMPFLTHTLTHAEYGALAVLNTAIALVAGITQFGLGNAFFRAYSCDYESKSDRLRVVSTTTALLLLISVPTVIVALFAAPWLAEILLKSQSFSTQVSLAALIVLMQNLSVPGFAWLRAENRAVGFSVLSVANLLINLGLAIVLVGTFHMGITGALLAIGGGYGVIVICTLPVIAIRAGLLLRTDIIRNLLSFGSPLVANFVSVWVLQLSDRYLLSRFGSLAQTASYSVAYSLGGLLGVVILAPFSLAWPTAMFAIAKGEDAPRVFQIVFRWYGLVLLFGAFAFSIASTVVFNWFFPPSYHSAAPVIPIVALSIMFFGVYSMFTTGISITRKTWFAVVFTTFAALINIGFNLVLIPLYGSMGAALSTLLAFTLLALIAYVVNQRIYPIPFEIGPFMIGLVLGVGFYIGGSSLAQGWGTYQAWGISLGALALYSGCLVLLGVFTTWWSHKNAFGR